MQCSLEDGVDYFSWELDWDYTIDYDSSEAGRDISLTATWSGTDHDIQEVSCDFIKNEKHHHIHAVIIVTGKHNLCFCSLHENDICTQLL